MTANPHSQSDLAPAVTQAMDCPAFLDALANILRQAEKEMAELGFECKSCGQCCDFQKADHRLYLSTGEFALLLRTGLPESVALLRCPFQQSGRCIRREDRALGCRLYFCPPDAQDAYERIYESVHRQMTDLHRHFSIPYRYLELSEGIRQILSGGKKRKFSFDKILE